MTTPMNANTMIKINIQGTVEYQKNIKSKRWLGYNVRIVKDTQSALQQLQDILSRKGTEREEILITRD